MWIGADCEVADGVRLIGPVAVGDRCQIGAGAALRDSIVFPGTRVEADAILIGAILGHTGIVAGLRPFGS